MKPITLEAEQLAELLHCVNRINTILGFDTQVLLPSPVNYSSKSKSELADLAGTTTRTFSKWLQPFRSELRQMGVTDRTKLLPPQEWLGGCVHRFLAPPALSTMSPHLVGAATTVPTIPTGSPPLAQLAKGQCARNQQSPIVRTDSEDMFVNK